MCTHSEFYDRMIIFDKQINNVHFCELRLHHHHEQQSNKIRALAIMPLRMNVICTGESSNYNQLETYVAAPFAPILLYLTEFII